MHWTMTPLTTGRTVGEKRHTAHKHMYTHTLSLSLTSFSPPPLLSLYLSLPESAYLCMAFLLHAFKFSFSVTIPPNKNFTLMHKVIFFPIFWLLNLVHHKLHIGWWVKSSTLTWAPHPPVTGSLRSRWTCSWDHLAFQNHHTLPQQQVSDVLALALLWLTVLTGPPYPPHMQIDHGHNVYFFITFSLRLTVRCWNRVFSCKIYWSYWCGQLSQGLCSAFQICILGGRLTQTDQGTITHQFCKETSHLKLQKICASPFDPGQRVEVCWNDKGFNIQCSFPEFVLSSPPPCSQARKIPSTSHSSSYEKSEQKISPSMAACCLVPVMWFQQTPVQGWHPRDSSGKQVTEREWIFVEDAGNFKFDNQIKIRLKMNCVRGPKFRW